MTFRFIHPFPDGRVFNRVVRGNDLRAAFKTFVSKHWIPELTGAIGVWQGGTLVARILVRPDGENGEPVPYIREIDPPPPPSLACGD
jgi:hypothetical protein